MADKWVVLCVHGVGDSEPSDLVDAVAPQVCAVRGIDLSKPDPVGADGPSEIDRYEMVRLQDERKQKFPVYMHRVQMGGAEVLFAELFWADLSRAGRGVFGFFLAVFLFVFGIRHIADQAADQPGRPARVLRGLLLTVANLLRGPLFALYLLATAYALFYLAAEGLRIYWEWLDLGSPFASGVVYAGFGTAALAAGLLLWREGRRRDVISITPGWSLTLVGALAVAAAVATLTWPDWFAAASQSADVPWPLDWLLQKFGQEYPGITPAGGAGFYLAATAWAGDAVLLVISVLMLAALVPLGPGLLLGPAANRRALPAAFLAQGLQIALWVLVVTPLDWLTTCALIAVRGDWAHSGAYWVDLTDYMTLQAGFIVLMAVAVIAVVGLRVRWASGSDPDHWSPERPVPRLIVNLLIQIAVLVCSLTFFVFTVWVALTSSFQWWPRLFAFSVITWLVVAGALLALLLSPLPALFALHVVMDIINHFQRKGDLFPLRERIQARFRHALRYLLEAENPSHILIIAHSQGTIITLEALVDPKVQEWLRGRKAVLATFGSPFTHLYQQYFPAQYGPLGEGRWTRLGDAVRRWVNLFRIDDYVGTNIEGPSKDWPENVPLPVGYLNAHTSYWQQIIFQHIAADLPDPAPPGDPTPAAPAVAS